MNIIDSAVRLTSNFDQQEIKALLARMDRYEIAHAVAAPADRFVAVDNEAGNAGLADLMRRYPKRFSGLAVANPWYGQKAVTLLEQAFAQGLRGLYLHPGRQGFHLTEAVVQPLVDVCRRHHKPVYSHTGTPVCAEPFQLAELARQFPEVTFIMGHAAYPDFWYDVATAAKQAPNLLVETSCQMGGIIQSVIETVGPERVLFGSGWPRSTPGVELLKIELMKLPPEVLEMVMRTNAQRCWGIKAVG